jgi:hypothetical protein
MVTLRVRSVMWFAAGIVIAIALVWSTLAWRAFAAPGSDESTIVSVTPVRVLDTRDPLNVGLAGPFVSTVPQDLVVTGAIPTTAGTQTVVPVGATGVLLNVTVTGPTASGFLSIRPADAPGAPTTSSLNVTAGATVPNAVQVSVPTAGADAGKIEITYNAYEVSGPTAEVLVDVVGYTTRSGLADLQAQLDVARTQTVTYSGYDMTGFGNFQISTLNGCAVDYLGREGQLVLPLPLGASILGINATVLDDVGTTPYGLALRRFTTFPMGDGSTQLTFATGGERSVQTVTKDLTPVAETVDRGERFVLFFDDGVNSFGSGLCSVTVTYQLSPTAVAFSAAPLEGERPAAGCDRAECQELGTPSD